MANTKPGDRVLTWDGMGTVKYLTADGWVGIQIDGETVVHEWAAWQCTAVAPTAVAAHCDGCDQDDAPTQRYQITLHDGGMSAAAYCDDCAALARCDWNGETKSIEPYLAPAQRIPSTRIPGGTSAAGRATHRSAGIS